MGCLSFLNETLAVYCKTDAAFVRVVVFCGFQARVKRRMEIMIVFCVLFFVALSFVASLLLCWFFVLSLIKSFSVCRIGFFLSATVRLSVVPVSTVSFRCSAVLTHLDPNSVLA